MPHVIRAVTRGARPTVGGGGSQMRQGVLRSLVSVMPQADVQLDVEQPLLANGLGKIGGANRRQQFFGSALPLEQPIDRRQRLAIVVRVLEQSFASLLRAKRLRVRDKLPQAAF